jgi:hypothetical protein
VALIVILSTVMVGVGSVPLMVGVKLVALLSNVAKSDVLFGKFPVQFVLSDQMLLVPPSQVAESACAGVQVEARRTATQEARTLSGLLLKIIEMPGGLQECQKHISNRTRWQRPQIEIIPQRGSVSSKMHNASEASPTLRPWSAFCRQKRIDHGVSNNDSRKQIPVTPIFLTYLTCRVLIAESNEQRGRANVSTSEPHWHLAPTTRPSSGVWGMILRQKM